MEQVQITKMGAVPLQTDNKVTTVYITMALDVMAALVNDSVDGNIYLFDNNKLDGSTGAGTEQLNTVVQAGDVIYFLISGLEVETLTSIKSITGPAVEPCGIVEGELYGSSFWYGKVKPGFEGTFAYSLEIQVESRTMTLTTKPTIQITATTATGAA